MDGWGLFSPPSGSAGLWLLVFCLRLAAAAVVVRVKGGGGVQRMDGGVDGWVGGGIACGSIHE